MIKRYTPLLYYLTNMGCNSSKQLAQAIQLAQEHSTHRELVETKLLHAQNEVAKLRLQNEKKQWRTAEKWMVQKPCGWATVVATVRRRIVANSSLHS